VLAVVARNLHCGFADEDSHVMYVAEVDKNSSGDEIANVLVNDDIAHT